MKKISPFIIFLSSLLWATDAPFRKPLLVGGLFTGFVSLLEHLFNSIVSIPLLWRQRAQFKTLTRNQVLGLVYIGAGASALATILFVKGATAMNYNFTVAALLQKFQPLFAILLAAIFLREKINSKFWLYAVVALVGAYLVSFGAVSPMGLWSTAGETSFVGPALAILAALLWAGGTVVGRFMLKGLNFEFVTGMRFVFGLVFLSIYVAIWEQFQFGFMTPLFWRNAAIIALLTGFIALFLYYFGLRNTKASVATLMELGYPLALTVINWKLLGIVLSGWQITGGILLLASVTALVLRGNIEEDKVYTEPATVSG
jgi:drug/metabolite transporter (DMT)-like permease